jgi:HSP90 family molecular chaperone
VASALLLVVKRSSLAIFSLLAKSSTTPSVIAMPNSFQKVAYFSGLFFAIFSNSFKIRHQKDIEVLLLSDRVDEWMVSNFGEFDGIPLKSIAKGDLEDLDSKEEKAKKEKTAKDFDKLFGLFACF